MTTRRAAIISEFGPPDVLSVEVQTLPPPAQGEVRLRQTAIGFNFIDIYQRKGIYPLPLPTGLGFEAAGVVEALGPDVTGIKPGDRVAYINAGVGAYSDRRNVPADKLVALPDTVSDEAAATLLFKGLTAQYLLRKTHAVQPGDLLLVHSAAGGVGQILTRWASALGATVIGTTGSPEKREAALAAGCSAVIDLTDPAWPTAFLAATGGRKARVVYDAVGKDTLLQSLDCAAPFGLVVSYGAASGKAPAIDPELLNKKGCLFLTRPSIFPHNADAASFRANAADLFDAIAKGHVRVDIGARFTLDEIAGVHEAAEARGVKGAILITP
ncbi:quinone oxidoreductase family protein [Bosea psychrotolerans]|uniref:NADPH:quinone reductase-like Zn-dependent oxidoreductase n=1 Tax=Bosea psychrotolerans TaxID=1871628 RepID=A0A2S4LZW7_9HYPH|nr:quinone oxidoreductase [Bosea psychrotolerans]POR48016.1 NADPH:quinone reductase-like Zn-dependent oxidoreductase [Bosea psychrotolerans]